MELVFHIGAPRTGSSSIQSALAKKYAKGDEVSYVRPRENSSALGGYLKYLNKYPNSTILGHFLAGYAEMVVFMRENSGEKKVIVSEENLAGDMLGKTNRLFKNADLFFTMMSRLSRLNDCKVIVMVRRMDQYIESCYKFQLQRAEQRTIDEFVRDLDEDYLNWSRILDVARRKGMEENVYLVEFDSYFKQPDSFDFSALPTGFDQRLELEHSNSSVRSPFLLSFMRRLDRTDRELVSKGAVLEGKLKGLRGNQLVAALEDFFKQIGSHKAGSWVKDLYEETVESSDAEMYPDVMMSETTRAKILAEVNEDMEKIVASGRCFGDFSHWGR